ncbi:MAG: hypothetical protein ACRC57_13450 [Sarcina sp.]
MISTLAIAGGIGIHGQVPKAKNNTNQRPVIKQLYTKESSTNNQSSIEMVTRTAAIGAIIKANINSGWWYWNPNLDGYQYYTSQGKCCKNGVFDIYGSYYGFNGQGKMLTGYQGMGGKEYLFGSNGAAETG